MKLKKLFSKKTLRKTAAVGLAAMTMLGSFSGCGKKNDGDSTEGGGSTGGNDSSRPAVTLTVFSERANYSGMQEGWMAKILKDKFNVEFQTAREYLIPEWNQETSVT